MIEPRQSVKEIEAYIPPLEGRRRCIRLDFNENTVGFPWAFPGTDSEYISAYPEYADFLEKLSRHFQVPAERVMLTNGTGEALFLIAFTFIEPGQDAAITSYPTFALIPHHLKLVGASLTEVPATPTLDFDTKKIETELGTGVKLAVFASPDNPTGATLDMETVGKWCADYSETLFVIDEAYAEYCETSVLPLTDVYPNLLVTRTFSKAWAMPGLRLGVIFGHPELLGYLLRVRAPYSVNSASLLGASKLIERSGEVTIQARALIDRKKTLLDAINAKGFKTHAGQGNFFLLPVGIDARLLCEFCRERGLLLRDRSSSAGMEGIVRITVGTEEENHALLKSLDDFRESRALIFDLDGTLVDIENKKLLIEPEKLKELGKRYRLFVATGRMREEYTVWADTLDPFFEGVYCRDDIELRPEPTPDRFGAIIERHNLEGGIYVGNAVDDLKFATESGLTGVGVGDDTDKQLLLRAGASVVIDSSSDIGKVFKL